MFGLGDSSYVYYNQAAKIIDKRMTELGAKRLVELGLGDEKAEEKHETAWQEWSPNLFNELNLKNPPDTLLPQSFNIII